MRHLLLIIALFFSSISTEAADSNTPSLEKKLFDKLSSPGTKKEEKTPPQTPQQPKQEDSTKKTTSESGKNEKKKEEDKEKKEREKREKEKREKEKKAQKEKDKEKQDKEKKKKANDESPWFIGTFLAEYGENVEPGQFLVTPSIIINRTYGTYDEHSHLVYDKNALLYSWLFYVETGITKRIDFTLYLQGTFLHANDVDQFNFADTQAFFGIQIAKDKKCTWIPDLRVMIGEGFPTGKFDRLNPRLQFIDATGSGAFEWWFIFIAQKIFYTHPRHPYKWNLNLGTILSSKVHVEGISVYGGGPNTIGIARPGTKFFVNLAYEYKFSKHWGWGIDIHDDYQNSSSFHTEVGVPLFEGNPHSNLFSLAPEIEYDFSDKLAIEGGFWFSVFGTNANAFFSAFFSLTRIF